MSIKQVTLHCTGAPDDDAMKVQLSAIRGVVEMNIDAASHAVDVLYDDSTVSPDHIASQVAAANYHLLG